MNWFLLSFWREEICVSRMEIFSVFAFVFFFIFLSRFVLYSSILVLKFALISERSFAFLLSRRFLKKFGTKFCLLGAFERLLKFAIDSVTGGLPGLLLFLRGSCYQG